MRPKPIILIAIAHFIVSRVLFIWSFGLGMARFDTGQPASARERTAEGASNVLDFPIRLIVDQLPPDLMPGLIGYIPFVVNSLIWGLVIWFVYSRIVNAKAEKNAFYVPPDVKR